MPQQRRDPTRSSFPSHGGGGGGGAVPQTAGIQSVNAKRGSSDAYRCVVAPWRAFEETLTPGFPDGQLNNTYRHWSVTRAAFNVGGSTSGLGRIVIAPKLNNHIFLSSTWAAGAPATYTTSNSNIYANLAGLGLLYYRVVALGARVRNLSNITTQDGEMLLTQLPYSGLYDTQTTVLSTQTAYLANNADPGTIKQSIWVDPDQRDFIAIATTPGNEDQCLYFELNSTGTNTQNLEVEVYMLVECQQVGSAIAQLTLSLGEPGIFAQLIANEFSKLPQFCLQRCVLKDDVIEDVKTAVQLGKDAYGLYQKAKPVVSSLWNGAKSFFSGLFGATADDEMSLQLAGLIVSMTPDQQNAIYQIMHEAKSVDDVVQEAEHVLSGGPITSKRFGKTEENEFRHFKALDDPVMVLAKPVLMRRS